MTPRWIKVFRDLWNNRSRTILVILSIAVGVFAIGMIVATQEALTRSLGEQYASLRPADAIILTEPALDDAFVKAMRNMRGVNEAEGRRSLPLRLSVDGTGSTWRDITLYAVDDYDDIRLFNLWPQGEGWPPKKGEVLLERATMIFLGVKPGDEILVKTSDGRKFSLKVCGKLHDLYRLPPIIEGWVYGYINMDTLRKMGQPEGYNELYLDVSGTTKAEIRKVSDKAVDRVEGLGLPVYQKTFPNPNQHPLNFIIKTVLMLLGLLAVLSMFLSGLLVVNVITALIAQQEKQIGIMKAIGANSIQIISLYFVMILFLGLIACLIAIPLSNLGANALAGFIAELINFDAPKVTLTLSALFVQFAAGLFVPLLAATPAILNGTKVSPSRVLSEYGINQVWGGAGIVDAILSRFQTFTRDILLSIKNPFRKRGRLILSLITLTFAGAVFMGVVNLQSSLDDSLSDILGFWRYDAWLILDDYIPNSRLINEIRNIPGVGQAEAWGFTFGRYVRPDGSESDNLYLLAPPAGTQLINPSIISGRALRPDDTNAILVSPGLLANEPDIHLGSNIKVKIEGREQIYQIVGVMKMMGNSTIGYFTVMNYDAFTRHVREPNRANAIVFTMNASDLESQRLIASQVEQVYDQTDIHVLSNFLITEERQEMDGAFSVIVALLLVMTIVLALVGGLGLMGTMSLNVIERTREIGVMRAFGASSPAIFRIVIIEGLLIGWLSWVLAIGFSIPISIVLARSIGQSFMDYPMAASYSVNGILIWSLLVVVISVGASFLPALRAVRLTVTQVLACE